MRKTIKKRDRNGSSLFTFSSSEEEKIQQFVFVFLLFFAESVEHYFHKKVK